MAPSCPDWREARPGLDCPARRPEGEAHIARRAPAGAAGRPAHVPPAAICYFAAERLYRWR